MVTGPVPLATRTDAVLIGGPAGIPGAAGIVGATDVLTATDVVEVGATVADGGYLDDDGYVFVTGRIDDVINVAGHRLSAGGIESVLATHPAVAECAVVGMPDQLKGQLPLRLVV